MSMSEARLPIKAAEPVRDPHHLDRASRADDRFLSRTYRADVRPLRRAVVFRHLMECKQIYIARES